MFILKKIIAPMLLPYSLIVGLLLIGLFLLWLTRKQKAGKVIITLGVVLLLILSYATVPDFFLSRFERKYPPLSETLISDKVQWVVVLGGGHTSDPELPATGQISDASLSRLVEGIRIHRQLPQSNLVLSGGIVFDPKPEARTMFEVASVLGVNQDNLTLDIASKDSKDQALRIKEITGNERFVLVTSALHLPRAMALFQAQGMNPIPAPTDFWIKESQGINPGDFFPRIGNLKKVERAVHEYLGILWAKLRGQI